MQLVKLMEKPYKIILKYLGGVREVENYEVICVYRVMMYANPLLLVHWYGPRTSLPEVNLYITVFGGDF